MSPRLAWAVFAGVALAQLAAPAHLIRREQRTLAEGTAFRFRTAPVDPADPFRGRYVQLEFEAACIEAPIAGEYRRGLYYAMLALDGDGFATLGTLSRERPPGGNYLRVRARPWGCADERMAVELPFGRYYLPEALAPRAEAAYAELNRLRGLDEAAGAPVPAWVSVRVRDGHAVLEELYLEGKPVAEYLAADT